MHELEVGLEECKMLIKRKVDTTDNDKALKRIETRLNNFIMQIYEREGHEQ